MAEPTPSQSDTAPFSADEMHSALFAQLVMQQSSMAMMLLGKSPHPQTGKTVRDLEAAQMFIGQLEMLEAKTRGNLNKTEEHLLKQSLMSLRMTFVEAVEHPEQETPAEPPSESAQEPKAESKAPDATDEKKTPVAPEPPEREESKKRFSKKFSL